MVTDTTSPSSRSTLAQWYENAPISILEAYASGKPVLGARIGGIPEMLKHEETGLLFESVNVESLVEQIQVIQNISDNRLADMGRSGHHFATTTFTANRYLDSICQLYKSLGVQFSDTHN